MKSVRLLSAALLAASILPAAPVGYNFSYQSSVGLLEGMLIGELQGDNNTVIVSSVSMVTFGGVPGPSLPFVYAISEVIGGPPAPPVVSLDGTVMDFLACSGAFPNCSQGFLFAPPGPFAPSAVFNSSSEYGAAFEEYFPENWSLTPKVPEPSSFALLGLGLLAAGVRRLGR